ncbi:MAG: NusG domain II-containing protein [Oscillospiraceae bacterium]|nr:NusG domain II-containing protein [Oscillospiraceae bacterium]
MKFLEKKHRNDIILVAVLLFAALAAFAVIQLTKKSGGYAVVVQEGKEIASYPLSEDISVTFQSSNGGYNTLVIKDGKADVTEADCPDKLCVNQHSISFNGETIVCLPNKLVVKIVSGEEADVDIIA